MCAMSESNQLKCWGGNRWGQTNIPDNLYLVDLVATGGGHTCVISTDNYAQCWGANEFIMMPELELYFNQSEVPEDLGQVHALSTGQHHTCAVNESGNISCWGYTDAWDGIPSDLG